MAQAATMIFSASILILGGSDVVMTRKGQSVCPGINQHNA